jgi:hypothetical protein
MTSLPRRTLGLSVLALLSACGALAAPLGAGASGKGATAAHVLTATKSALSNVKGVHIDVSSVQGTTKSSVSADIGATAGRETYTTGDETFTIVVTPTYAYLSGSKAGLITLMGLTAAEQKLVGAKAISMKKGSSAYTEFADNLTTGAFTNLLPTAKETSLLPTRDKATDGYQLTWVTKATSSNPKATSVLTVSSGKKALPIKETVTTAEGSSLTSFSKWGESVKVSAPSSTVPYATIFKS